MNILVTGGAGYIGSHATLALLQTNFKVVVLDNLSNSSKESLNRVEKLTGHKPVFVQGDVRNYQLVCEILSKYKIKAVLHFAGLKSVDESVSQPLEYYDNNVNGTFTLCKAMAGIGVFTLIFSSSATVYGDSINVPITEEETVCYTSNPYGRSKLMVEQILSDLFVSDKRWSISILRYFNPVGAHESGLIGEDPSGIPKNLLPYITKVALGKLPKLSIFGNDYPTSDGTGVRDYIHVTDLAEGHLAALKSSNFNQGVNIWNLGTGKGYSVMEIIRAFEIASGKSVPYQFAPRRAGDIAASYANPTKAFRELGWTAQKDIVTMMKDTWRWQVMNPKGYN